MAVWGPMSQFDDSLKTREKVDFFFVPVFWVVGEISSFRYGSVAKRLTGWYFFCVLPRAFSFFLRV